MYITYKIEDASSCPNGKSDPKEACDCSKAPGWVEGQWKDAWCHGGKCFSGQEFSECKGKDDGYDLGDSTWCFKGQRDTSCPTTDGNIIAIFKRVFQISSIKGI